MKLLKYLTVFFLTAISFTSLAQKSTKDLIVKKWKLTEVEQENTKANESDPEYWDITEEEKKELLSTLKIEFTRGGKIAITDMKNKIKTGTYTLSKDEKMLSIIQKDSEETETAEIKEITNNKLVIQDGKSKLKMTFVPQ